MTFILRRISQRAGGGPDIVRERPLAAVAPVIGRGADCDIPLNDLAVALHHARFHEHGDGRILVEALGSVGMEIDGAFTRRKEISVAGYPRIVIGSHLLELRAGGANEIVVNVSRVAAAEGVAAADLRRTFSLSGVVNKRRASYALLFSVLVLCLAWPVYAFLHRDKNATIPTLRPDRQWSSGPLSRGHRFLEKNCNACHQRAFVSVRDSACLACHQARLALDQARSLATRIKTQGSRFEPVPAWDHAAFDRLLRAKAGYSEIGYRIHAAIAVLFNHPRNRCASCHTEHVGIKAQRVNPGHPALPSSSQVKVNCAECHGAMSLRLPDTKLGDAPSWVGHPPFRPLVTVTPGPTVQLARVSRNRPIFDRTGLFFSHRQHLAKDGGVSRMAERLGPAVGYGKPLECANCHRAKGEGFQPVAMKSDCAACHSLAYAPRSGAVLMLPHGKPGEVVAALEDFYGRNTSAMETAPGFGFPASTATGAPVAQGMPLSPSQQVERGVRAAFSKGGACYGCHTVLAPLNRASLLYRIAPINLIQRYLPSGDFDHGIRQHKQDARGRPICAQCHKAERSQYATDVLVPRISECRACHGRPKPFTAAPAGTSCSECHAYHRPGTSARLRSDQSLTF